MKKILYLLCIILLFNANAETLENVSEKEEPIELIESQEEIIEEEIIDNKEEEKEEEEEKLEEENINEKIIENKENLEELIEEEYSIELLNEIIVVEPIDELIEEIEEVDLESDEEDISFEAMNETIEEERYDYNITLNNFSEYNIIALQDAYLSSHSRGSIWIGGILTGQDWCGTDDGSINHEPSGTESYVYLNESNIYFQGRTDNQSTEAYKLLSLESVEQTQNYWGNLINKLPNNENWIYIQPDENGYVNLLKWDYQNEGGDESIQSIEKVYWTDATKIDMGGLAGHLIAPFAEINITWCNYRGSILGKIINTNGEGHINYWKPEIIEPDITPAPGKIILQKTLINDVWHIRCDVMDGTTFQAGGGFWKTDVIMNPKNVTSKEGHRSNKCGDANHWIIWLNNEGTPFRMDEIKSGATGGTLSTMIFEEVYSPEDLGLLNWNQLEPTDTELIEKYKENFKIEKDITTIVPGERIYWVTWNGNQRWYHTGVPYVAPPTFTFYIDGEPYPIIAGESLELSDVLPGAHEIREDVSLEDYIITVYGAEADGLISTINIIDGETIEVEYVNEIITPPTVRPSTPPTISPTITPTPTPTPSPTPTPTLSPTPSFTPTPTPTPTLTPSPSPTTTITPTPTPTYTPTPSPSPTPTPHIKTTSTPTPLPELEAELINTSEPTLVPTITPIPTHTPTPKPTISPERRAKIIEYIKENPPTPDFSLEQLNEQELEDLIEIFDYKVPLYGRPLETGDSLPIYIFIFGTVGIIALLILLYIEGGKKHDIKERK